jgi:hypothetical protein
MPGACFSPIRGLAYFLESMKSFGRSRNEPMNAIMAIRPYRWEGLWVFDDERVGLDKEPFISGADTIIEKALQAKGITDGEEGFILLFSAGQFPGYDFKLKWVREGDGGNWYYSEDFKMEGWLCPALFEYFESAPKEIYTKFQPRTT